MAEAALPAAPATSLAITAPAAGTEIRLSQVCDRRSYETQAAGETIHTTLGADGALALQWRPKVAEGQVDQGLTSQSAAVLDVQEDGLRLVWDLSLEFRRSQRERFFVDVPKGFLVEKVTGGNVRGWEVRNADKEQEVEVSLLKPAKDRERFALHLWRSGAVGRGELAEFDVPLVSAVGVAQAGGELTICRSPLLELQIVRASGAARADIGGDASATATESPLGLLAYQTYRFAAMPFAVRLTAAPLTAKTAAEVQTLLRLSRYQRTLESRVLLHVQERPIHRIEFFLPEELNLREVFAPGEFQWSVVERNKRRLLVIYLAAGQQGDFSVSLDGALGKPGEVREMPLPRLEVCGVDRQTGDVAVRVDPGFDVAARDLQGCQETELERVYPWLNPQQAGTTRLALHYARPNYGGALRLSPRKPDVSCETISDVTVKDRAIEETILLSFEVRGAGIRELSFLLPAWMADSRISVPLLQRKSVAPMDKSPDAPVRVRIELQDEVMGQVRVLVANDRLPTPGVHAAPIPVVETGRTNRQFVALKSAGRDEVSVHSAVGLEPLERNQGQWRELTAALGADVTLAYMVAAGGRRPRLEFNAVRREDVQVAGASIGLAETMLVLDADGAYRAAAIFHTNNATEQFLDVELPGGAVLWTAVVAGEPVKPIDPPKKQGAAQSPGRVLIPLVKTAVGDRDYAVVLKYGGKTDRPGWLSAVRFPLVHTKNIHVERSVVKLYLPENDCWFDFGGTMRLAEQEADVAAQEFSYRNWQIGQLAQVVAKSDRFARAGGGEHQGPRAGDAAVRRGEKGQDRRQPRHGQLDQGQQTSTRPGAARRRADREGGDRRRVAQPRIVEQSVQRTAAIPGVQRGERLGEELCLAAEFNDGVSERHEGFWICGTNCDAPAGASRVRGEAPIPASEARRSPSSRSLGRTSLRPSPPRHFQRRLRQATRRIRIVTPGYRRRIFHRISRRMQGRRFGRWGRGRGRPRSARAKVRKRESWSVVAIFSEGPWGNRQWGALTTTATATPQSEWPAII